MELAYLKCQRHADGVKPRSRTFTTQPAYRKTPCTTGHPRYMFAWEEPVASSAPMGLPGRPEETLVGKRQDHPRGFLDRSGPFWIMVSGVGTIVVILLTLVGLWLTSKGSGGTTTEPPAAQPSLSQTTTQQVLTPSASPQLTDLLPGGADASSCENSSLTAVGIVGGLHCATTSPDITLYAYEFDSQQDYLAGLNSINSRDGWNPVGAGGKCIDSDNKGLTTWYNSAYPDNAAQIEECFYSSGQAEIIWTLPVKNNIYLARATPGTSLAYLDNWFSQVGGGIPA